VSVIGIRDNLSSRRIQDMKHFIQSGVGIILLAVLCASAAAQITQEQQVGRAGEWLSWTPVQRNAYVYGIVDGYLMGFLRACNLTDQLFETGRPHRLGDAHHPTDMPSGRCLAHRGEFSEKSLDKEGHIDVSPYTDIVTAFYKGHPSCRDFPFALLLQSLSSKYETADRLYELALKGGLEGYELRSHQWCSGGVSPAPKP
jgi:hypothetical protein